MDMAQETARHDRYQCEKVTKVAEGTMGDNRILQVVRGVLGEQQPNFRQKKKGAPWTF